MKGTPEEVAERLIKEHGTAEELKQRELERKGAEAVPGIVGSGLERGEPAAIAQVRPIRIPAGCCVSKQEGCLNLLLEVCSIMSVAIDQISAVSLSSLPLHCVVVYTKLNKCVHVQSAVDRAAHPKEGATVMPEAAEKAKDMLVEEIRDARYK